MGEYVYIYIYTIFKWVNIYIYIYIYIIFKDTFLKTKYYYCDKVMFFSLIFDVRGVR